MVTKIIRKAGLGNAALNVMRPFVGGSCELPELGAALEHLSSVSPDPGNSCLWEKKCGAVSGIELDIIIPAYNAEAYIARCLDSALNQQTTHSFRLIVIDDGSKDATGAIIDSYGGDPRLLIKHQENRGLAGARNAGLELSDAQYVMFLDSDDFLTEGSIEALMSAAKESRALITEGGFIRCDLSGRKLSVDNHKSGRLDPRRDLYGFACMKLFRAEVFERICFPLNYLYEDSIMSQLVYPLCQAKGELAFGVSDYVYNYSVNPNGITGSSKARPKSIDSLWVSLQLYRDRQKLGLENDQAYYEYILNMLLLSYRRAQDQSEETKKAMFVVWKDFIDKEFSAFKTENSKHKILEQAVREENFPLYKAACELS